MKKYYSVKTKCGHVGKLKCVWIDFAIVAENGKEAAKKARQTARAKHHHKNTIQSVKEISLTEFINLKDKNDADPYLHAKNHREQLQIENFEKRVEMDDYNISNQYKKTTKKDSLDYRIKKMKLKEESWMRTCFECLYEEVA